MPSLDLHPKTNKGTSSTSETARLEFCFFFFLFWFWIFLVSLSGDLE